jgi:hypothetical protein
MLHCVGQLLLGFPADSCCRCDWGRCHSRGCNLGAIYHRLVLLLLLLLVHLLLQGCQGCSQGALLPLQRH